MLLKNPLARPFRSRKSSASVSSLPTTSDHSFPTTDEISSRPGTKTDFQTFLGNARIEEERKTRVEKQTRARVNADGGGLNPRVENSGARDWLVGAGLGARG